jgi:Mg-chelatase subunit ChlD
MSSVTLEEPLWLIGLIPAVGLTLLLVRLGRPAVPGRQHRWAVGLRIVALAMILLAAAQPTLALEVSERTVLFVVDRSASIPGDVRAGQDDYVAEALDGAGPLDLAGVAVFGEDLRVDAALARGRIAEPVRTAVGESSTNIESALRSALALMPTEGSRRIVLLTDGVATEGDVAVAAAEAAAQGVAIDVVASEAGTSPDALVSAVRTPATARIGETVTATVVVESNTGGPARIVVQAGDGEFDAMDVSLSPGTNEFTVDYPATDPGFLRIGARVEADFDTRGENNVAEGITRVLGAAQVAVVAGEAGAADELVLALTAGGMEVDLLSAIPADDALLEYDAVVLVNVGAPGDVEAERLASYVENLGRGLVVVGGDQAYGLGDYQATAFEDLLPVRSNPDDMVRRQSVAEVLAIDTSGSMGTCHARGEMFIENGVNKTDISRAGAQAAIDALSTQDRVGVVAFSSGTSWAIPLGPKLDPASVEEALAVLKPEGDTEIANGLDEALQELQSAEEDLRHIVLFTDGWDPNEAGLLPMAEEIADSGVTLSVVGTGEGAGTTLQRMAQLGGGRYYAGADLSEVPEIFVEETLTVARALAQEGTFVPMLGTPSQVTHALEATPPLRGYVLVRAKDTAALPMLIGEEDPLLATWQRGLGRVSAWTSDATSRWLADWITWDGYVDFWGRVVSDVLPGGRETPPQVAISGGELMISFEAGDVPLDAAGVATVRSPDGNVRVIPLQRTSGSEFAGTASVSEAGAYWVAVSVDDTGQTLMSGSSGAVSSYSDEFAFREPDPGFADALAATTGGRVDPEPSAAFDRAPVTGKTHQSIWPWLAGLGLLLFLADVTLRRLVLTGAVTARSARRAGEEPLVDELDEAQPPAPPSETMSRLLERKRKS